MLRLTCLCFLFLHFSYIHTIAQTKWPTTDWKVKCDDNMEGYAKLTDAVLQKLGKLTPQQFAALKNMNEAQAIEALKPLSAREKASAETAIKQPAMAILKTRYDDFYGNECSIDGEGAVKYVKKHLIKSSEWLEGLGFKAPKLHKIKVSEAEENNGDAYLAYIDDHLKDSPDHFAAYNGNKSIYILFEAYNKEIEEKGTDDYLGAIAHEVFHAVQASHQDEEEYWDKAKQYKHGWLQEGSAEAVGFAYLRNNFPFFDSYDKRTEILLVDDRDYSYPLHQPKLEKDGHCEDCYKTKSFFYLTGEAIQSKDKIFYLNHIFKQNLKPQNGLIGLDEGLKKWHKEGLYHYYPEFIKNKYIHKHSTKQYKEANTISFKKLQEETFSYTGKKFKKAFSYKGNAKKVATEAYWVKINVPTPLSKSVATKIYFKEDHPDLHLIIDGERLDNVEDKEKRNIYKTTLDRDTELFIQVANVAKNVGNTSKNKSYQLMIEMDDIDLCSSNVIMSTANPDIVKFLPNKSMLSGADSYDNNRGYLLPADYYEKHYENPSQLHPGNATIQIKGLINDSGQACVDHIGSSAAFDGALQEKSEESDFGFDENFMNKMEEMFGDDKTEKDIDKAEFEKLIGVMDGFQKMIQGNNTLIKLYSPNPFSWQWDVPVGDIAVKHGGVGGWQANASTMLVLLIPNTSPDKLVAGQSYPVVLANQTELESGEMSELYSRWEGQVVPNPDSDNKADLYLNGTRHMLDVGQLKGTLTVQETTPAALIGYFNLSGTAKHTQDIDKMLTINGANQSHPDNKTIEKKGNIVITGTFEAPAMVEVQRINRIIMNTRTLK